MTDHNITPRMVDDAIHHLAAALTGQATVTPPPGAGLPWWEQQVKTAIWNCDDQALTAIAVNGAVHGLSERQLTLWYAETLASAPAKIVAFWEGPCELC
jgi:hypothetical protein